MLSPVILQFQFVLKSSFLYGSKNLCFALADEVKKILTQAGGKMFCLFNGYP